MYPFEGERWRNAHNQESLKVVRALKIEQWVAPRLRRRNNLQNVQNKMDYDKLAKLHRVERGK